MIYLTGSIGPESDDSKLGAREDLALGLLVQPGTRSYLGRRPCLWAERS